MHKTSTYIILFFAILTISSCSKNKEFLSLQEKQWLVDNPNLKVSIFELFPPYMFANANGEISGLYIDYLELIEKKLNYKFQRVFYTQNEWPEILKDSKKNEIDLIIDINKTPEREKFFTFFKPLFNAEISIITREKEFEKSNTRI